MLFVFSYLAGSPSCLYIFLVFFAGVSLLMVVLTAFPGTRGAGVPFRHVETTAVARPTVPFFVWVWHSGFGHTTRHIKVEPKSAS